MIRWQNMNKRMIHTYPNLSVIEAVLDYSRSERIV